MLSWEQVCARRVERHGLGAGAPADIADLVGAMCGAHAQVLTAAEWSIGVRMEGVGREAIQQALWTDRTLVKTFGARGTVHLLPSRDLPLWTGALGGAPSTANRHAEGIRMTEEQTEAVVAAIDTVLADAELTVDELTEAIVDIAGSWAGDPVIPAFQGAWARWRQATNLAAHRGVLCFGANRGRLVTYTSPKRWLPDFAPDPPVAAAQELVRRYLHAYGPATAEHFGRWLGTPKAWTTKLFATTPGIEQIEPGWIVAGDKDAPSVPDTVRLLPYFDAYTVGCHPREVVFPGRASERALNRGQAGNYPVLLVDGKVAGVWHGKRSGRRLQVTVEPLVRLTGVRRRALDDQVARLGEFLAATPELTIGTVSVGPHA